MALNLAQKNVPWELAWGGRPPEYLTDAERMAFFIVFGQLEGGEWDFDRWEWKKPKE